MAKKAITAHGYVVVDTNSNLVVGDTFSISPALAWKAARGRNWTRKQLETLGWRCVKATLTTM